jgi:lipopolysaccharide/colanic/teichoic acid biosynthesis glycosyltransferase
MSSGILVRKKRATGAASTIVARSEPCVPSPHPSRYFRWKGLIDRTLAAILLVPAMPIIAVLGPFIRLTSPGPAIYRQKRVGKNGRRFFLYKLRSMHQTAEATTGAVWSTNPNDPRVTRLGRILRRFHLDELPQLVNVLRGEMSLVGPRPERPEFVEVLSMQIPSYRHRLVVPPGVTGLAQLNLPPDSDITSVRRKLVLDVEYVQQASLWLDLRILMCTAARMLKIPLLGLFGVRRSVEEIFPDTSESSSQGECAGGQVTPEMLKAHSDGETSSGMPAAAAIDGEVRSGGNGEARSNGNGVVRSNGNGEVRVGGNGAKPYTRRPR